jgi:hypothetical protein
LQRLGFVSPTRILEAFKHHKDNKLHLPPNANLEMFHVNENDAYQFGKSTAQPHRNLHGKKSESTPYALIHMDIKIVNKATWGHNLHFVMIVDDATRYHHALLLKHKSDLHTVLLKWHQQEIRSRGYKVNRIRLDNAGEQTGRDFDGFLTEIAARPEYTSANSSASNGVAERAIRTIFEIANSLRHNASLPDAAWGECVMSAVFIHNRLPSTANTNNSSPYFMLNKKHPDLSILRIIGSKCYVHVHKVDRKALDRKAEIGTLVGYSQNSRRYRVLMDPKLGKVIETSHIVFAERVKQLAGFLTSSGDEPTDLDYGILIDNNFSLSPNVGQSLESSKSAKNSISSHNSKSMNNSTSMDNSTSLNNPTSLNESSQSSNSITTIANNTSIHSVEVNEDDNEEELVESDVDSSQANDIIEADDKESLDQYLVDALKTNEPLTIRRSSRVIKAPERFIPPDNLRPYRQDMKNYYKQHYDNKKVKFNNKPEIAKCNVAKIKFREAIKDKRLVESMRKELKSMFDIGAFSIEDRPIGKTVIGNTWAHKLKHGPNGEFIRAKSRVCPWGFQQVPFIDFNPDEVAAPTLNMESALLLLCICVQRNMFTVLVDIDGAFQIPKCKEELYMEFPEGMTKVPGKVIRLVHSLNGTKQSAHNWHILAHSLLIKLGYRGTLCDPCLYYKWSDDKLSLVGLYVDDFRCVSELQSELDNIVTYFKSKYAIKVQPSNWWLGMKVDHDIKNGTLKISHEQYIKDVLELFNLADCKGQSTPAEPNTKLIKSITGEVDTEAVKFPYREAVGKLLWLARTSRPDILYAVNQVGAHCNNPNSTHVIAVKKIFRYLQGTKSLGVTFRRGDFGITLEAYSDADYAGEPEENDFPMRSITGMVAMLKGIGPIGFTSSLQPTISRSTAEAEYKAIGVVGQWCSGVRQLLIELGFVQVEPTLIYGDNQACLVMAKSKLSGSKTRHIKLNHHYIRELVNDGEIKVEYCSTTDMLADIMTKALPTQTFVKFRDILLN